MKVYVINSDKHVVDIVKTEEEAMRICGDNKDMSYAEYDSGQLRIVINAHDSLIKPEYFY